MAQLKTYVLLPHTESAANVFIQVNKQQRVRMKTRIVDHAFLKMTFQDYEGRSITHRLKFGCNELDQAKQMKEFGIEANRPFSQIERDSVRFYHGSLSTTNQLVQKYLESIPLYDKFWDKDDQGRQRYCDEVSQPLYKCYDENEEIVTDNKMFKKRLDAANKIAKLNLGQAHELLRRLYGGFTKLPLTIEAAQNELVDYMDGCEEKELDDFMREERTAAEELEIVVGRAIDAGIVSFDNVQDQVTVTKNKKPMSVFEVSSTLPQDERKRLFIQFLLSDDGKALRNDLAKKDTKKEELVLT